MFQGGFTVLMAVYGRDNPELFHRAVDSVYSNTLVPDDFVLVVDGPVPNAIESVIKRFENERNIRTLRLERNVGLAAALNHGLRLVRTAWVVRADADDVNLPSRFERQAEALKRIASDVDLLGSAIVEVDKEDAAVAVRRVPLDHNAIVRRLPLRSPFNHMTVAFKTSAVLTAGGYPDIYLKEDYALWASMIAKGARCVNMSDVLVRATAGEDLYRRRGGWSYACSELGLQLHLYRLGYTSVLSATVIGAARATVSVLPPAVRGWIYQCFLRSSPVAGAVTPKDA